MTVHLHSTMYLFQQNGVPSKVISDLNLHSTMYLFQQNIDCRPPYA